MTEDSPECHNAEFVYKFTEASTNKLQSNVDVITSRLTTLLGFNGVLVKFATDMSPEGWLFSLKFATVALLVGAVCVCTAGLKTINAGKLLHPEDLLRPEVYDMDGETINVYVINSWVKHMKALEQVRNTRKQYLDLAIALSVLSVIMFATHGLIHRP